MKTKQFLITLLIAFFAISSSFSQTKRFINEQYIFNVNPKSSGYDFKALDSITTSDTLALINNSVLGGKWVRGRNLPVKDVTINNYSHNGTLSSYLQGIDLALDAKEDVANKGVADGYASLDSSGKVPLSQIHSVKNKPFVYPSFWNNRKIPVRINNERALVDFDINREFDLGSYTPYYLSPNGNDANDGLTDATPKKTLQNAISAGAELIYLLKGIYYKNSFTKNLTISNNTDLLIVGEGVNTIVTNGEVGLIWTLTTNNTYSTPITSIENVKDSAIRDDFGMFLDLQLVNSQAECESTVNSYYYNGIDTLYVHTQDERVPDDTLIVQRISSNFTKGNINNKILFKDLVVETPAYSFQGTDLNSNVKVWLDNVYFSKSEPNKNNVSFLSISEAYLHKVKSYNSYRDGFNYHNYNGVQNPFVYEIFCESYNAGYNDSNTNNQCSSSHEDIDIIRIGGSYYGGNDDTIADVADVNTIILGCEINTGNEQVNTYVVRMQNGIIDSSKLYGNKTIEGGLFPKEVLIRNSIYEINSITNNVIIE